MVSRLQKSLARSMLSFFFLGKNLNNEVGYILVTHNNVKSRVNLRIFLFVSKWLPRIASFSRSTSSASSGRRSVTISMTHAIVIRESPTSSTSFICINIELRTVVLLLEVETVLNCGEQWLEICGIYDSLCLSRWLIKNSLFEREKKLLKLSLNSCECARRWNGNRINSKILQFFFSQFTLRRVYSLWVIKFMSFSLPNNWLALLSLTRAPLDKKKEKKIAKNMEEKKELRMKIYRLNDAQRIIESFLFKFIKYWQKSEREREKRYKRAKNKYIVDRCPVRFTT